MKLSKKTLELINIGQIRLKIALACATYENTVIRWIKSNSDNLTKATALKVIREETGLTDSEIFDAEPVPA